MLSAAKVHSGAVFDAPQAELLLVALRDDSEEAWNQLRVHLRHSMARQTVSDYIADAKLRLLAKEDDDGTWRICERESGKRVLPETEWDAVVMDALEAIHAANATPDDITAAVAQHVRAAGASCARSIALSSSLRGECRLRSGTRLESCAFS